MQRVGAYCSVVTALSLLLLLIIIYIYILYKDLSFRQIAVHTVRKVDKNWKVVTTDNAAD